MKKLLFILFATVMLVGCQEDNLMSYSKKVTVTTPSNIETLLKATPIVGGVTLKWRVPQDSHFPSVEVRHQKKGKMYCQTVSKYADSISVIGLIHDSVYTFQLQSFNNINGQKIGGIILKTDTVRPIARPMQITATINAQLNITASMIRASMQETSEGPVSNLVDGNSSNFWHSSWSDVTLRDKGWSAIAYLEIHSPDSIDIGALKEAPRGGSAGNMPDQIAIMVPNKGYVPSAFTTSSTANEQDPACVADSTGWHTVYTSPVFSGVNKTSKGSFYTMNFNNNFKNKFFRIVFLHSPNNDSYVNAAEMQFWSNNVTIVNFEADFKKNYYGMY
jgi:hypothetical protein